MQAEGNESGVRNAQRAAELAAAQTDAEKALLKQIYEAEDAARRAAEAANRANSANQEMDQAAAAAAKNAEQRERDRLAVEEERQRRAKERTDLELELLRATARGEEALQIERSLGLKTLPKELHALQRRVWAAQDAAKAEGEAREVLTEAHKRESDALKTTIDRFKDFAESLSEFRRELIQGETDTGNAYRAAQERFRKINALAAIGDEEALGQLKGAGSAFLEASRANAGSAQQYQRDLATVLQGIDTALGATDDAIDYAELQLTALDKSVAGLIEINESVVSVEEAIARLHAAGGGSVPQVPQVPEVPNGSTTTPAQQAAHQQQAEANEALQTEVESLREEMHASLVAIATHTSKMAKALGDASAGDTLRVSGVKDSPVYNAPVEKVRGKWEIVE
jgi:hypothetical protein